MNRPSNKDRLLSMVQGRDPDLSPRPLVYDLTKYGGYHIMVSNRFISDDELRTIAQEDKEEYERLDREYRKKYPTLFNDGK